MIKNKHIITITLLTNLLASRVSKSQEFYTCVPKKSWWKDTIKESVSNSKHNIVDRLTSAQSLINVDSVWNLVADNNTQGTLNAGIYKVVVAGGSGGKGGDADIDNTNTSSIGAVGGAGEIIEKIFQINQSIQYTACIGSKGQDGCDSIASGTGGGGGAGSGFAINSINLFISVSGGGGGGAGGEEALLGSSGGGGGLGCAKGGNSGKSNYWNKDKIGLGGTITGMSSNLISKSGKDGHNYANGGGLGGKSCANGGSGNNYEHFPFHGSTCAVSGKENFGDGYVKIYKYIG